MQITHAVLIATFPVLSVSRTWLCKLLAGFLCVPFPNQRVSMCS